MKLALQQARKGLGRTSPNPAVGAVVVQDGRVIAAGYHRKAGGPHAEVDALALPAKGEAYDKLRKSGVLDRVPAGHMNAALSIQQFLLNIVVDAVGGAPLPPPPPRIEPPPPPRIGPPPPAPGSARAPEETQLRDRPGGDPVLHVARGIRLAILEEQAGWTRVSTPAGQTGWVRREEIEQAR